MKRFNWRIFFCLAPVLIGALISYRSWDLYRSGRGGFKLGVDLAGGTDLIYEVDVDKYEGGKLPPNYSPELLASVLKQRIDPADLYNVTIRPVSNTRVEIILPTGGKHQAEAEETVWRSLLDQVAEEWKPKKYKVTVDRKIESVNIDLLKTKLLAEVNEQYQDVPLEKIRKFINDNYKPSAGKATPAAAEALKTDEAAWNNLVAKTAEEWKPRTYEVGRGRIPLLVNRVREQYEDKSPAEISKFIEDRYQASKEKGYVTGEQVQTVKELISRVGSLEFRILANTKDDEAAIKAAENYFTDAQKDAAKKAELESAAVSGKAPPRPRSADGGTTFDVPTIGIKYSYSWVELGKTERQLLGLSNAVGQNPAPNSLWQLAAEARKKGVALVIPETYLLGGSLLYSRDAVSARLSDKDANKKVEYFILTREAEPGKEVTGKYLKNAKEDQNPRNLQLVVAFHFDNDGGALFQDLTTKNKPDGSSEASFHRNLSVVLDEKIESAPRLNAIISTDGLIEGNFKKEDVNRLVRILNAGSLPASLKRDPVSESTMGPTLGQDTINDGTFSVGLAFVAVMLFMLVYYRFAGLVACIALIANLILTVAFMTLVNATFTLPGLAGLVLMLGMAVDANVLIYERLREERDRGATLALAIRNGYDRAFPTIIDTHLSSIFTAIVLYAVGNDQLKGFGISLTAGLFISLFTSLYMTRLMFDIWQYKGWLHKLSMFRLLTKPNINFMAIRYYWFTATIVLTIVGAAVFVYRLDRGGLNIDFVGGTAYSGQLVEKVTMDVLRKQLAQSNAEVVPDLSVEQIFVSSPEYSDLDKSSLFNVRTSQKDPKVVQAEINRVLGDKLKRVELKSYTIDSDLKRVVLEFAEPSLSGQDVRSESPERVAFASRAQVSMLLSDELKKEGLDTAAQQIVVEGLGREKEGHFQWMEVQFVQPVPEAKLKKVLADTKEMLAKSPQPERLENFDSQLAKETQWRAFAAILLSWGAILLYLWFRFGNWTFGMATVLCLIHDLFFTLGIIAFCHYIQAWWPGLATALLIQDFKIDLPAVAALLTLVGYSVNDTIVVFDRVREVRGKNPLLTPQMINDSVNQTLSRTILTAFTVWLVVFVLYVWGGEGVHLFAFVMVVGVIVGTYSSIYIASPLLLIFGEGKAPSRQRQVQPRPEPVLTS
jgi:SecD/SecF fusion protein